MPASVIHPSAFSSATRGLVVNFRYLCRSPSRTSRLNAPITRQRYSSIANAMLGKALKVSESASQKNNPSKPAFPAGTHGQNGNIQEQLKKPAKPSQSISSFTGYINSSTSSSAPLSARSSNISTLLSRSTSVSSTSSRFFKESPLPRVLSRHDSFQDGPDLLDLTQDAIQPHRPANTNYPPLSIEFEIDENDFDDDENIDLDAEYDLPMSMPPQKTLMGPPPSPYELPGIQRSMQPSSLGQRIPSSAPTWSSSSPSHRATPPGALKRRLQESENAQDAPRANVPRPAKRRTLPWVQERAEKDETAALEEEEDEEDVEPVSSPSSTICFRCKKMGHESKKCPEKGKGTAWDYTPLSKDKPDKHMPWNTTGSAVAEEKRRFKDKQKARKLDAAQNEEAGARKSKGRGHIAPVTLSQEQQKVLDLVVKQTKSVFFTGSAGTGKSVLMRAIIAELRKKHAREPDRVAVTASTGLAACNIGGVTLHSFGGIGLGKDDIPTLVKKIKKNAKAKNRWIRTKILIIDEISMVDGDLFDKLEGIARMIRNNGRPFGGIQLVITGDFFQLPPVPDNDNKARGAKFAFDAGTWSTAIHHTIGLTEVFRQKDPVFANMLNELRLGKITNETISTFKKLSRKLNYDDGLQATELFPTRSEVENSNENRMRSLHGKEYKYDAQDTGTITDLNMREKLLANMMAPKQLRLKKGAQVMLIKNMDDGLVNGSLGKVIGFMNQQTFELYDSNPEIFDESIQTEEQEAAMQAARSSIKSNFMRKDSSSGSDLVQLPLVRFTLADGTSRDLLICLEDWKIELPSGEVQAQRKQLPLILAWALSIHKAQGQTLDRVKIDLKKIFEKGQAYVALSRATSQAGLEVQNFDKSKVMAHPRVAEFYNSLYTVNRALEHPTVAEPPLAKKVKSYEEEFSKSNGKASQGYGFENDEGELASA